MKKHKKILTCISLKRYLRGVGMNNYWNHEPEFFWYKKKVRKSQEFLTQRSDPPPSSRFFEKIPDVIFLRPLNFFESPIVDRARLKITNVYRRSIIMFERKP